MLEKKQFSWHNGNVYPPLKEYDSLYKCFCVALEAAIEFENGDELNGADHYFADYIAVPHWTENMTFVTKIGRHLFYK